MLIEHFFNCLPFHIKKKPKQNSQKTKPKKPKQIKNLQ